MSVKHTGHDSLHVPDESIEALYEWIKGEDYAAVRAIAGPVVVTEFRRLADVVPVGPARTILLNEADRVEGTQR